jgi:hypothetical protein
MSKIIGIEKVQVHHGGRYDTGFWTSILVTVIEEDREKTYSLSANESEDLEYTIMKKVGKYLKMKIAH